MRIVSTFMFFILLPCSFLMSQNNKPVTGKPPVWITATTINYKATELDKEAEDGVIDMNFEKQVNLNTQSVYVNRSKKIISEAGVQDNSTVTIYFDPTFQQLTIHSIAIIRNNDSISKLNLSKIKVVHVEDELDAYIYDGQLQATLILDDVRKGDVIQYSYTLKGFNPIFQNKFQYFLDTKFGVPIYNIYYKIIAPSNRTLFIKNNNDTITASIKNEADNKVYEWHETDIHPVRTQDQLPDWYDPYGNVIVSEFNSWREVNNWAVSLFPKNTSIGKPLQEKIKEINTGYPTKEAKTSAALRFVQDDIRYMGIEIGVHSHQPANPNLVFNQRFGDCKEKSYLLCVMLNAMGIDACPVLINTSDKKAIANWQPLPTAFDHCTVCVTINNKRYWLDPTISYQRGPLSTISFPDYQYGLVLTDTTTALTSIPPQGKNEEFVREIFTVPSAYGLGYLKVITTYSGSNADDQRSYFNSNSNYEIQKNYLNFYKNYFNNIKSDSLDYVDNDSTGIFTTTEYYSIDSFWTLKKGSRTADFSCFVIDDFFGKPKETKRTMPIGLKFPIHYKEELDINLPGNDWNLHEAKANVQCAAFTFNKTSKTYANRIVINYEYERLKDNVMPEEASAYFDGLKKINDNQDYVLTWDASDTSSFTSSSTKTILNVVVILLLVIGLAVRWTQRR